MPKTSGEINRLNVVQEPVHPCWPRLRVQPGVARWPKSLHKYFSDRRSQKSLDKHVKKILLLWLKKNAISVNVRAGESRQAELDPGSWQQREIKRGVIYQEKANTRNTGILQSSITLLIHSWFVKDVVRKALTLRYKPDDVMQAGSYVGLYRHQRGKEIRPGSVIYLH